MIKGGSVLFAKCRYDWLLSIFLLALLHCNSAFTQEPQFTEFSAKVSGDIYGQVKVINDIDGDGKRDMVFGATDGQIHIWSSRGGEILAGLWPKHTGGPVLADVEVADLDGDNVEEIIAGSYDGNVYALNIWGKEIWKVDTRGTIQLSGPQVDVVDSEGTLNVFVGSHAGKVSRIDSTGRLIWEVPVSSKVSSKVVLSDLDGDGTKEVIAKDDNGKINVLNLNGAVFKKGWPQSTVPNQYWPFEVGVTDINGDGKKEIYTTTPEKRFILWNNSGGVESSFGLSDAAHSAPRAADLDSNGKSEFVITQANGVVNVVDSNGIPLPGWPYKTTHSIYSAPQIVDIDGDGKLDIVYTAWDPEGVGKQAGYVMALNYLGKPLKDFPKYIGKSIAPVTIADLDGDGFIEIIAAGGINYTDNQLHVFPTRGKLPIKMAVLGTKIEFN